MKALEVNWLPWSVLKISGAPYLVIASLRASIPEIRAHGIGQSPRHDPAGGQVQDGHEVGRALGQRDVGDVGSQDLVRPFNAEVFEQVRVDTLPWARGSWCAACGTGHGCPCATSRCAHGAVPHREPSPAGPVAQHPAAGEGIPQVQFIDAAHRL